MSQSTLQPVFVDDEAFNEQLAELQGSTLDDILQVAWPALLGTLKFQSGPGKQSPLDHLTLQLVDGKLLVAHPDHPEEKEEWVIGGSALAEAVLRSLAGALAETLNAPPNTPPRWGWGKNVERAPRR